MNQSASVKRQFHVSRRDRGEKIVRSGKAPPSPPPGRLPRVTRLMALAIHFDELLRTGQVESQAELARHGQVTRARLTQIMNLLNLSPQIQEKILFHPPITTGRDPVTEREIRSAGSVPDWEKQAKQAAACRLAAP